jgi:hypothetical protein
LKLFPRKISFFSNIFGGNFSAEFPQKFSQEKMYEKSAPDLANFRLLGDSLLWVFLWKWHK